MPGSSPCRPDRKHGNHPSDYHYPDISVNNILVIFFFLATGVTELFAQLPICSATAKVKAGSSVTTHVSPVIRKDIGPMSLATIGYQALVGDRLTFTSEVSTIERFNSSGAAVAGRGHHVSAYHAVERKFNGGRSSFPEIKVHASTFLIWDEHTFSNDTRQWDINGNLTLHNGSSLGLLIQQRHDYVREYFLVGDFAVGIDHHVLRNITLQYAGSTNGRLTPYLEATSGIYYMNADRHSIRIGEHYKLAKKVSGFADVEFTYITGEVTAKGYLTRVKLDYKVNPKINTGLFMVNNTFSHFNGVLAFVRLAKEHHVIQLEYREVRTGFRFVESAHPFFASNVLVQYRYAL
jgi:hypothetical protein